MLRSSGQNQCFAFFDFDRFFQFADTNLGSLKILKDCDRFPENRGNIADVADFGKPVLIGPERRIEAAYIHAGADYFSSIAGDSHAGPTVATILHFFILSSSRK